MEYDDAMDEEYDAGHTIPSEMKALRACIPCLLVKTYTQFYDHGCENCPWLEMQESKSMAEGATTKNFEGMVAMMQPRESWVAKWQRIGKLRVGWFLTLRI